MVAGKSPDWLPPGFTERFKYKNGKKIKYYYNDATGAKYNSKKDVISCATDDKQLHGAHKVTNGVDDGCSSSKKVEAELIKTSDSRQGLPEGWTMEECRNSGQHEGHVYKTDNMDKSSVDTSPKVKSSASKVTIETTIDSDLPPGWIKEIKIRKYGNKIRRDPYYMDPISRYVFRSKVDALKYVKTNDIGSCTCKPFKRELEDLKLINEIHINSLDKSTPDISPQSKLMAGMGDILGKNTRSKALKTINNVDKNTTDISPQSELMTGTSDIPGKNTRSKAFKTINNVDKSTPNISPQSILMTGTGEVPGKNTRSKALKINNVDKSTPDISPQSILMTGTGDVCGKNTSSKALKMIDNVDKSCPDVSPEIISMASAGYGPEKKMKSALKKVSIETTIDNDLPPGWIKEIKTSKYRNKTRRDPYYTDPVSGYVFRSKLDALRYLKTNDIGFCAMKPYKRELDDLKISCPNPGDEKLSEPKKLLTEGDSNGGEASATKSLAKSKVKGLKRKRGNKSDDITKVTSVGIDSTEETKSGENSINYTQIGDTMTTENELSESVMKKQTNRKVSSKKSKARKSLRLPSRSSRRLAAHESVLPSSMDSNEPPLKASGAGIKADTLSISPLTAPASIPLAPDIEADEVAAEHELVIEKIVKETKPQDNVEKSCAVEVAIPENQADGVVNEKQPDDSKKRQESQLSYDFGDAWSDPLEFAFKTLCGEIPLEDNLRFSGDLNDPLNSPFNEGEADTFLKPANSDEPMPFHNAFVPGFESSKQHGTIGQLELNSLPSSESLKPSLDQHVAIDLSLANSSATPPPFTQHETIALSQANSSSSSASFKPYGAVGQFQANSFAPFNHYWAGSQSQANLASTSPSFRQYGTVGPMPNSLFPPSFRPVGQWPPTNQSLFSSPSGTIGFSTLNSFNVQPSAEAGRKNGHTKFNP